MGTPFFMSGPMIDGVPGTPEGQLCWDYKKITLYKYSEGKWTAMGATGPKQSPMPELGLASGQPGHGQSPMPEPAIGQVWLWNNKEWTITGQRPDNITKWCVNGDPNPGFTTNHFKDPNLIIGPMKYLRMIDPPEKVKPITKFNRLLFLEL
jgi:hypothetical protein